MAAGSRATRRAAGRCQAHSVERATNCYRFATSSLHKCHTSPSIPAYSVIAALQERRFYLASGSPAPGGGPRTSPDDREHLDRRGRRRRRAERRRAECPHSPTSTSTGCGGTRPPRCASACRPTTTASSPPTPCCAPRCRGVERTLSPIIGYGMTERRDHRPRLTDPHGFDVAALRAAPGDGMLRHRHDSSQVLIVRRGRWEVTVNDQDPLRVQLDAGDTLSVPPACGAPWSTCRPTPMPRSPWSRAPRP